MAKIIEYVDIIDRRFFCKMTNWNRYDCSAQPKRKFG